MNLLIDIDVMEALRLFYDDEEMGVWEGDFIKAEKDEKIICPKYVHDFLNTYGYLSVNMRENRCYPPQNWMKLNPDIVDIHEELIVIGEKDGRYVAVSANECNLVNPLIYIGDCEGEGDDELGYWSFDVTKLTTYDFLMSLFMELLTCQTDCITYHNIEMIDLVLNDMTKEEIQEVKDKMEMHETYDHMICWDQKHERFFMLLLFENETMLVSASCDISLKELEQLFHQEFYQNSLHCDYEHALKLLKKIIKIREKEDKEHLDFTLQETYKLAGRCCWALNKWEEAECWYKKAEEKMQEEIRHVYAKAQSLYMGIGNFYYEKGDRLQSQQAYEVSKDYCRQMNGSNLKMGQIIQQQAIQHANDNELEEALHLFEEALAIYKEDPKACKYEIARCQQLRGETKRKLKKVAS